MGGREQEFPLKQEMNPLNSRLNDNPTLCIHLEYYEGFRKQSATENFLSFFLYPKV